MSRKFLLFILSLCLLNCAFGCSCAPTNFEKRYCESAVSVKGKVVAVFDNCPGGKCDPINDQVNGKITYVVRVLQQFKGEKVEDNVMFLNTAVNGALCGINLQVDETYLFNLRGKQSDSKSCPSTYYDIGLCDFPSLWNSLSAEDRRFVIQNANTNQSLCKKIN